MRIELRSDSVVLDGYVNVTLRESRELPSPRGKFVEQIMPRTFERALSKNDSVDLLFNHDRSRKLGSTKSGELQLNEDNVGLRAIATITDETVMEKAKKGELRGWSFGFGAIKDSWSNREDGMQKRTVEEIDLYEISILDKTPAYIATSIEMRGEEEIFTEIRNEEFRAKTEDKTSKATDNKDKTDKTAKNKDGESNTDNSKDNSGKDSGTTNNTDSTATDSTATDSTATDKNRRTKEKRSRTKEKRKSRIA